MHTDSSSGAGVEDISIGLFLKKPFCGVWSCSCDIDVNKTSIMVTDILRFFMITCVFESGI